MTSKFTTGQSIFVPFWVVMGYYTVVPPQPFIKATIVEYEPPLDNYSLDLGPMVVDGIPSEYLIPEDELEHWANKIAEWFKSYKCSTTPTTA